MKKHTITIVLFLNILILQAQNNFEKINKEICFNLKDVNIKTNTKLKLLEIESELTNRIVLKNNNNISIIKATIKRNFPELGINEINRKAVTEMFFYLLDNCEKYLKLKQKTTNSHNYPNKKSLEVITTDFNQFLIKNSSKSYKELNSFIDENIVLFLKKHYDVIMKDYTQGPSSSEFQDDLISSLMMNSDLYFKTTMHAEYND